jgi:quinol monooxygenase YgiN
MLILILVDARIELVQEMRRDFIAEVEKIFPLVRSEVGCNRYELFTSATTPTVVHFLEEWESQRHLDEHLTQPHMQDFFAKTAKWHAAPTELKIYEVTSAKKITMND